MTGPVANPDPEFQLDEPMAQPGPHGSSFPIQRVLIFLLKFWWVPSLTFAIGLFAGGIWVIIKPPTYVCRARMWETVKLHLPEGSMFSEDVQNFVGTQTELLQSATLRDLALSRLRMTSNHIKIPVDNKGEPLVISVRVVQASKSSVFTLEGTGSQASYTRAYLDALMEVYLEYKRNVRKVVSGDTLASISEQVQRTERELKNEQEILLAFQQTNNMAVLQQEGAINGGYLANLKTKLSDLQLEDRLLSASAADAAQGRASGTNARPLLDSGLGLSSSSSSSSTAAATERQYAFKELELLKIQRDRLGKYLRPKHPKMVKLETDIDRATKLLEIYERQNEDQLASAEKALVLKTENVLASIAEWEGKVRAANTRIAEAERLRLNVERVRSVYDRLVLLLQNVGISRNIDQETLSILEPASLPKRTYTQDISQFTLAAVGGLGLGLGLIVLMALRDDRFTSPAEVSQKIGNVVVGQLPDVSALEGTDAVALLGDHDQRHAYAESYRSLRSSILFLAIEGPKRPKVLLITSAVPDEGKSTVALNLARTLAQGGSRVLLVDGDLRKGHLHDALGFQSEPGLADVLLQPSQLEMMIQTNCVPNLAFLSRGSLSSNPGDLFLGPGLDQVLAQVRKQFDFVLIDSSPVFAADDATALAHKVDATLFVVCGRFSRARLVREALEVLYQRQAKVLGLVFNRANANAPSYYYSKYANYHATAAAIT